MKYYASVMETRNKSGRGELLPDIALLTVEGQQVRLSDYRGRSNLILILGGALGDDSLLRLLEELAGRHAEIDGEEAEMILVLGKPGAAETPPKLKEEWPFLVLSDGNGHAHRVFGALGDGGSGAPAVFIADRYGEIFAEYHAQQRPGLPETNDILQWLAFINSQCPECGVPEWPE